MTHREALEEALAALLHVEIPLGHEFHYNNTFKEFKEPVKELRGKIRRLLLQLQVRCGSQPLDVDELDDSEEAEGDLEELVEGLQDDLLEKVDRAVDKATAQLKAPTSAAADGAAAEDPNISASVAPGRNAAADKLSKKTFAAAHMDVSFGPRPQDAFDPPVDNSNAPFRPNLEHWAGHQGVADVGGSSRLDAHAQRLGLTSSKPGVAVHPLEDVLHELTYQDWQLEAPEPLLPQGLDETPLTYIDTPEGLRSLADTLLAVHEVAVDLEAHSYRSFQGFCCLMQLSTRKADYLVDVIALRSLVGPILAPMFANVKIVKVLHGSDSDIVWLQRDFGIYVANLFDTGQAARVLSLPSAGLAYLLSRFCSIKADKRWQLADWRVRPLSAEALQYARMDTHYLLYIYDCLKVELEKQPRVPDHLRAEISERGPVSCLGVVLERSRLLCLQRYEKDLFTETSYLDAYRRCQERMTRNQLAVFAGLYAWRDRIARARDESPGFALPRALLVKVSKRQPTTVRDLRAALGTQGRRSAPLVVELASEVVEAIASAQQQVDSVPDPDELPGDRVAAPSPAAALASRNAAVDDAMAAAAAQERDAPDDGVGAATFSAEHDRGPAGRNTAGDSTGVAVGDAVPEVAAGVQQIAAREEFSGGRRNTLEASEEHRKLAQAGQPAEPKQALLVPKQLPPLGAAAQPGSGLAALLGGGAVRPSSLAGLLPSPQTKGAATGKRASVEAGIVQHAAAESAAETGFAWSTGTNAPQPAGTLGASSSGLGRMLGTPSCKAPSGHAAMLGGRGAQKVSSQSATLRSVIAPPQRPANGSASMGSKVIVEALKAQFALPFALPGRAGLVSEAPPSAGASAVSEAAPEAEMPAADKSAPGPAVMQTPEETQAAPALSVRAVMDQLHSENRFEALAGRDPDAVMFKAAFAGPGAAEEQQADGEEDYLPLPISEKYKLPSRKAQRATGQGLRDDQQLISAAAPVEDASLSPGERERRRAAAEVAATLAAINARHAVSRIAGAQGSMSGKKHKKVAGMLSGTGKQHESEVQPGKGQAVAEQGAAGVTSGDAEQEIVPFDFAAARASAKGLDIFSPKGSQGRGDRGGRGGGGRRGRGGRDKRDGGGRDGREKGTKRKGFNPWDSIQEEAIKGGKRSAVMPRSGNRTMTFS